MQTNSNQNQSDYNITHYSFDDMLDILSIDYFDNLEEIYEKTNERIFEAEKLNNQDMKNFFQSMQNILVSSFYEMNDSTGETFENNDANGVSVYGQLGGLRKNTISQSKQRGNISSMPFAAKQTKQWLTDQALPQTPDRIFDPSKQMEKNTNRYQRIQVYNDNDHMPMNREQLGVNNTFNLPVAQDSLNPNLKNVTNRFLILDSQFRQYSQPYISTDYVAELSDTLTNVLSLRLYSIQIPTSWYVFDSSYQNTDFSFLFFLSPDDLLQNFEFANIQIPNGNYADGNSLVAAINTKMADLQITGIAFSYELTSNRVTFTATSPITFQGMIVYNFHLIFFDPTMTFPTVAQSSENGAYTSNCSGSGRAYNQSLGWSLGFRNLMHTHVMSTGGTTWQIIAEAVLNLNGFSYFILSIDDFNQNHINNSPVNITPSSKSLPIPNNVFYSNCDQTVIINEASTMDALSGLSSSLLLSSSFVFSPQNINPANFAEKYGNGMLYTAFPQILNPTLPRTLTLAQIYSANEKMRNNKLSATNISPIAPSSNDVLAIIPIKTSVNSSSSMFTDYSGPLQDNKREYYGPVNIERMKIKLKTDTGKIVNLNGLDWSFTIVAEILYQY